MGKKADKNADIKLIDIHTHILPGVDDGALDLEEAVDLCRIAYENKTRAIILTPHCRGTYKTEPPVLKAAYTALSQAARKEVPKIALHLGNEVFYHNNLSSLLTNMQVLPLCDSRYVLLEFSYTAFRSQFTTGIKECLAAGKVPIIAHPERYEVFRLDRFLVDDVLNMGALLQLNADSVMGKQGRRIKRFCHKLLRAEKAHFIASDAHDTKRRSPILLPCYHKVCKKYGEKYAKTLFWRNPYAIIEDNQI